MHRLGFFDRPDTRAVLSKLAEADGDWTFYVGLGGTIDRTGITWYGLVERLLARFEPDASVRATIIEKFGLIPAATMLESLYFRSYATDDEVAAALQTSVANILYGSQQFMRGQLIDQLSNLAFTLADRGRSVAFVTPNYDAYLYDELLKVQETLPAGGPRLRDNVVVTASSPVLPKDWTAKRQVSCVHIHGYVASGVVGVHAKKAGPSRGFPVIGEYSYNASARTSKEVLEKMFRNRNLLVVGSSVTDGPLVSALLNSHSAGATTSRPSGHVRQALQPLQSSEWQGLSADHAERLMRWNSERLHALGVEAIYPDFFGQVGWFISELQRCIQLGYAKDMLAPMTPHRYTERLQTWWDKWSKKNLRADRQMDHHRTLVDVCADVRRTIGAPAEELLKVELWCRWSPNPGNRELGLWASSVGSWSDVGNVRRDEISLESQYRAVQIFCAGAPRLMQADATASTDRWRSYIGVPIVLTGHDRRIPVGVVSIASTREVDPVRAGMQRSSIRASNLDRLQRALRHVEEAGAKILKA